MLVRKSAQGGAVKAAMSLLVDGSARPQAKCADDRALSAVGIHLRKNLVRPELSFVAANA